MPALERHLSRRVLAAILTERSALLAEGESAPVTSKTGLFWSVTPLV